MIKVFIKDSSIYISKFFNNIKSLWEVATAKTPIYEYILIDLELREKHNICEAIAHFRCIGSRVIEEQSVMELNNSNIFTKFPATQAHMIVTLATIESVFTMDPSDLAPKYKEYLKKCAESLK